MGIKTGAYDSIKKQPRFVRRGEQTIGHPPSRTIKLAARGFSPPAELLELGYQLLFINVRQGYSEAVGGSFELGEVSGLWALPGRGNVHTKSFATPGDGDGSVGFQKAGDAFAEFSYADFDGGHGLAHCVHIVYANV